MVSSFFDKIKNALNNGASPQHAQTNGAVSSRQKLVAPTKVTTLKVKSPKIESLADPQFLQIFNKMVRNFEVRLTGPNGAISLQANVKDYVEVLTTLDVHVNIVFIFIDKPSIDQIPGGSSAIIAVRQQVTKWYESQTKESPIHIRVIYLEKDSIPAVIRRWSDLDKASAENRQERGRWQYEIDRLLYEASKKNASDIHIQRRDIGGKIRLRVYGDMMDLRHIDDHDAKTLIDVFWNTIAEATGSSWSPATFGHKAVARRAFSFNNEELDLRLRAQILPHEGTTYDLVCRILPSDQDFEKLNIYSMNYHDRHIAQIQRALRKKDGMVVVCGTTGSGKTTTLAAMSSSYAKLYTDPSGTFTRKMVTIEDPIEIQMPIATQVLVGVDRAGDEAAVTHSTALRWALRGDPDFINMGEVRSETSADGVSEATNSGHKLVTTVHASATQVVITRLHELGIPLTTLSNEGFLDLIVYQMLTKLICPDCGIPLENNLESVKEAVGQEKAIGLELMYEQLVGTGMDLSQVVVRNYSGCKKCGHTGRIGQIPVVEAVTPAPDMLRAIQNNDLLEFKRLWYETHGGWSLTDHALHLIERGRADPIEIFFSVGDLKATNWKSGL